MIDRWSLRLSAMLLLVGQLLYIVVTLFHADGAANDHATVFVEYARSGNWMVVHLAQFVAMAILLAGLFSLAFALERESEAARYAARLGAASAVVALALYGVLQAVDGIANKQADVAWVSAPAAERAARFASAEAIRWIEWGLRSYQNFALGIALLLFAAAFVRTALLPRPLGYLVGFCGLTYLLQGWLVGTEGFSRGTSNVIVVSWIVGLAWMIWLIVLPRGMQSVEPRPSRLAPEDAARPPHP